MTFVNRPDGTVGNEGSSIQQPAPERKSGRHNFTTSESKIMTRSRKASANQQAQEEKVPESMLSSSFTQKQPQNEQDA